MVRGALPQQRAVPSTRNRPDMHLGVRGRGYVVFGGSRGMLLIERGERPK
jgi:hypothetical protein